MRTCRAVIAALFLVTTALAFVFAGREQVAATIGMLALVVVECCTLAALTEGIRTKYIPETQGEQE